MLLLGLFENYVDSSGGEGGGGGVRLGEVMKGMRLTRSKKLKNFDIHS